MLPRNLVIDNGSYTIKAGFAGPKPSLSDCRLVPNCIARTRDRRLLVGAQLETCRDFGGMAFRRPVEKGYLVNWEAEKEIWDRTFLESDSPLRCDPRDTRLLLAEAPNAPISLQNNCDQMVFEEYEFSSYLRCVGPSLIPWAPITELFSTPPPVEAALVIDSGYSHTHVVPVISGQPFHSAVRRIDIGGKFLTNYLKELVSLRTWNMMEEPYIINAVKESVCYISTDFNAELEKCKRLRNAENPIARDYILPDYNTGKGGFARAHQPKQKGPPQAAGEDGEQVMVLGNERFTVPELLFSPSDVGLKQAGVVETVGQSLEMVPEALRGVLLANVVLVGGNARIPGFKERVEVELRPIAPVEATVRVAVPDDPEKAIWAGGARTFADEEWLRKRMVTRQEYNEHGLLWAQRKMQGLLGVGPDPKETSADRERRESRSHKKRRMEI